MNKNKIIVILMILVISNLGLIESYRNNGENDEEENTNGLYIDYDDENNADHEGRLLNALFKKRGPKHKLNTKYDDINLLLKESFLNDRSKRNTN